MRKEQIKWIKKWTKALRSGKYKRGIGGLRHENDGKFSYCCLGVLCDIKGRKWKRVVTVYGEGSWGVLTRTGDIDSSGITDKNTTLKFLSREDRLELSRMNDTGTSFKRIANWIEKNLLPKGK